MIVKKVPSQTPCALILSFFLYRYPSSDQLLQPVPMYRHEGSFDTPSLFRYTLFTFANLWLLAAWIHAHFGQQAATKSHVYRNRLGVSKQPSWLYSFSHGFFLTFLDSCRGFGKLQGNALSWNKRPILKRQPSATNFSHPPIHFFCWKYTDL